MGSWRVLGISDSGGEIWSGERFSGDGWVGVRRCVRNLRVLVRDVFEEVDDGLGRRCA